MPTRGNRRNTGTGKSSSSLPLEPRGLGTLEAESEYRAPLPDGRELILTRSGRELRCCFSGPEPDQTEDAGVTILDSLESLFIRPILPDRPLVLQPESELRLIPGAVIKTSVSLPLGISLQFGNGGRPRPIKEFPSVALSKTWFGDPVTGEAAYSWKTSLAEMPLPEETNPLEAVCPLTVRNESPENLDFKRMILRVPQLSLFSCGMVTVTNTVTVRFKGQTQVSQVTIGSKPIGLPSPIVKLSEPRMPVDKTLLRRSFAFIKTMSAG